MRQVMVMEMEEMEMESSQLAVRGRARSGSQNAESKIEASKHSRVVEYRRWYT